MKYYSKKELGIHPDNLIEYNIGSVKILIHHLKDDILSDKNSFKFNYESPEYFEINMILYPEEYSILLQNNYQYIVDCKPYNVA